MAREKLAFCAKVIICVIDNPYILPQLSGSRHHNNFRKINNDWVRQKTNYKNLING